jgi:hypothetical protein
MAEQWRVNEGQRYIAHRSLAELLAAKGDALRPGLTVDEAADVIFTLLSPEVYLLLTAVRGWPPARWQDWAADTIARAILRLPMMAACTRPVGACGTLPGNCVTCGRERSWAVSKARGGRPTREPGGPFRVRQIREFAG